MPDVRSRWLGDQARDAGDLLVHRLDQVDDPRDAGDGQPVGAAKVGSVDAVAS